MRGVRRGHAVLRANLGCRAVVLAAVTASVGLGCDDALSGPVGGLILTISSFEAVSTPELVAIDFVEIGTSRVEVDHSSGRRIAVDTQPRTIVIRNSALVDRLVAQYQVPPGSVLAIRIFPRSVTIHLKGGDAITLDVPSASTPSWEQSGWKIEPTDGTAWPIVENQLTGVRALFHFDEQMLHNNGVGYKFKPTAPGELFAVNPAPGEEGVFADQLTVMFKQGTTPVQVGSVNAMIGATIIRSPVIGTAYRLKLPASTNAQRAFDFYNARSEVQGVLPAINFGLYQIDPE